MSPSLGSSLGLRQVRTSGKMRRTTSSSRLDLVISSPGARQGRRRRPGGRSRRPRRRRSGVIKAQELRCLQCFVRDNSDFQSWVLRPSRLPHRTDKSLLGSAIASTRGSTNQTGMCRGSGATGQQVLKSRSEQIMPNLEGFVLFQSTPLAKHVHT